MLPAVEKIFDLPLDEARRLIASGAPVFLTVDPVEFHGPHLSLHNDRLIAEGLVRELHQRLAARHPEWPLLVGSDLEVGVEPCPGPGSRHTSFEITRELVMEACRALHELGVQRVIFMTFHGGPLHNLAIDAGVRWLNANGVRALSPFNSVLYEMLWLDDPSRFAAALSGIADPIERDKVLHSIRLDFHAGLFETSVALYYAPRSVSPKYRSLPPCPDYSPQPLLTGLSKLAVRSGRGQLARELEFAAAGVGWSALRPFPGYTSRPHLASAEIGGALARMMIDRFEQEAEAVWSGKPPPAPIMTWLEQATLRGRVGGMTQPALSEVIAEMR
jgi:creatinine amidohydrolase